MVAKNQEFYGKFVKKWKIWRKFYEMKLPGKCLFTAVFNGAGDRNRTYDPLITNAGITLT